ncbi:Rhamnolipids biosynthesis 3-oxoacyl-[acyl-carrier-protein] reductase [Beauveria bassiana]|uniref:Rhamnolipids biosynthesis 3-oxoacyl-[acyl-carrier-protein] reductase n=1 Tax=Beauveria bassiana TaxID=176275 RepID=A0A2N6NK73_BEABA|nr:Rhamnolipids biosynthesis 3-oxoacyl-[acyl-carrier-protein] reductase [Beauveria bassiana]
MDSCSLFNIKENTGAKGIGRMITQGYAESGANVFITGRDAKACDSAVAELQPVVAKAGGSIFAIPANLQSYQECERLVAELATAIDRAAAAAAGGRAKGLHVLVNNAGAVWGADIDSYPDHAWSKVLTLDLQRVFTLSQKALPLLEQAATADDPARLIHIGSIDGIRTPATANFAYSAAKAGLHQLSRHLARDLGPRFVTSNVIACGPFPSHMMKATLEAAGDYIRSEVPLRRVGKPEDAAGACIYLSSKAGAFCNGATIRVDGGASQVAKI